MRRFNPSSLWSVATSTAAGALVSCLLSGCGLHSAGTVNSLSSPIGGSHVKVAGRVNGGQNPVSGSTIQVYEIGTAGYMSSAKPLISGTPLVTAGQALTDINGNFNITGDYSCDAGSYVYVTATGGNPGITGTVNNTAIDLMAAIGPCIALQSASYVTINEVTTVAGAYALAQFSGGTTWGTAGGATFGTNSTNVQGVANALATAQVLAPYSTGISPGNNANGTASPEYWQVNMIADILAACINTSGPSSTGCTTLFTNVNPQGSGPAAPADTLQAALSMALSPTLTTTSGGQINKLFNLATSTPPFQPIPPAYTQISDLTIGIAYAPSVPGTAGSSVAELYLYGNGAGCSSPSVTISAPPVGGTQATATVGGTTTVTALTLTNPGSGYTTAPTVTINGCTTAPAASAAMTGVNLLNRVADSLSVDQYGNVWVGSQAKLTSSTGPAAGINPAVIVELDPTGNPIPTSATPTTNAAGYQIYEYTIGSATTQNIIGGTFTGGHYYGPLQTAFDTNNNLWFTDSGNNGGNGGVTRSDVVGVTGSGAAYGTGSGFSTAGYSTSLYNGGAAAKGYAVGTSTTNARPLGIAIDGSNDIWFTTNGGNTAYTSNTDDSATITNLAAVTLKGTYGILAAGAPGSGSSTTGPGTSVVYSGPGTQLNYFLYIDPNKTDTAGNPIPGAPFVWGFTGGNNPTGNSGDGAGSNSNLLGAPQGSLFQYYTAASGLDYLGATLHAGAPTPLTHNTDPNGVVTYNGITSNAGGFLPTLVFPSNTATGCSATPTASVVLGSGGSVASVTLVGTGTSGCTATTTGTVTVTLPSYNVPTPTTVASITYNAAGGVITGFNINTPGAGYSTGTTELDATLSATGGTTGPNVTVADGATSTTARYAFLMSNPNNMVFDGSGSAWILDNNPIDSPSALGDPALTVANGSGGSGRAVTKLSINYGTAFTPAQFVAKSSYTIYHGVANLSDGAQTGYIATDGGGNVYMSAKTDYGLSAYGVGAISSTGTALSPANNSSGVYGFSGSCYWQSATNNGTGTSCTGTSGGAASPFHRYTSFMQELAVDPSGNLWYGAGSDGSNTYVGAGGRVVEIVGLAAPIVTPTAVGLKAGTYGTKP
jgi:hypothetical protein